MLDSPLGASTTDCCLLIRARLDWLPASAGSRESPSRFAIVCWRSFRGFLAASLRISRCGVDKRLAVGILELLGPSEVALHFSNVPAVEDLRDARAGVSRVPHVFTGVFCDVRYVGLAGGLGQKGKIKAMRRGYFFVLTFCALLAAVTLPPTVRAGGIALPAEAVQAMDEMYGGDPDAAINSMHGFEQTQAQNPVGYLLEAEARWWKIYCAACEIKWGMVDAWRRGKEPGDDAYFALADRAISLAQAQLAKSDSAEMHLYAGMGWALKARLYSLRGENRNVARTGVMARTEFLRATQIDPQISDAWAGIGLYNYYVDTLSPIVKVLRFFMGIPGGNKREGIRQMEMGMNQGAILMVEMRFNLAKNLRTYDQQYERAAALLEPLVARYPHNPEFLLLLGNLNAELGRNAKASTYFHSAMDSSLPDAACAARARGIAGTFLGKLH